MPWYDDRGRPRFARAGSETERRVIKRGGTPLPDEEPGEDDAEQGSRQPVKVLVAEASDADLATIDRLLREEYAGPNRASAIEQLERIRARKSSEE